MLDDFDREVAWHMETGGERADLWEEIDVPIADLRALLDALALQAEMLREVERKLRGCQWYWPEDDTSSDACMDSPWEALEYLKFGEVAAVSRGGVIETRYYAVLPPADDSDSDDDFEVDEATEAEATAKVRAELERRAKLEGRANGS
jgi:hypothetical protein